LAGESGMTAPTFKDYDTILADMMTDLQGKGTGITDMNPGSIIRTLFEVFAARLDEGYYTAEQVLNIFFIASTSGDYLDRRVEERGLTRFLGSKSAGNIRVARSTPAPFSQLIPKGTQFGTEDRKVQFKTTMDATLLKDASFITIPVIAMQVGKAGNLQAGTALNQVGVAISLIESAVVSDSGLAGGADRESDEALRQRYLTIIRSSSKSGNKADYLNWALEVSGVGWALVDPLRQGPGTVRVVFFDSDGNIPSPELIHALQEYLDPGSQGLGLGKAPIGAKVTVEAPIKVGMVITVPALEVENGYTLTSAHNNLEAAARTYILSIPPGGIIRIKDLEAAINAAAGVGDFGDVLVNGSRHNIELAVNEKASM